MRYSKKKRNIINKKRVFLSKKKSTSQNQRAGYSRKRNKTNVSRKKRRTIKRQKGGGPIDSIMSMVPFVSSGGDLSIPSDEDYEENDQQSNQNVLVGALCNQYLKNNIRGTIKTEYDPVLDSLCSGVNIASNNTIPLNNFSSNSVSLKKRSKKKPHAKLKQAIQSKNHSKSSEVTKPSTQSGGVKVPSFLGGVKGLANFYSLPIRTGIKAVNSGINSIKNYTKKKSEASSAKSESESESSTKEKPSSSEIDDDIAKAEAEILKEKHADLEARDEVASNFSDNKNLDIKEVIKK